MLIAVFKLLLYDNNSLRVMVQGFVDKQFGSPAHPTTAPGTGDLVVSHYPWLPSLEQSGKEFGHTAGNWVVQHLPTDPFKGFVFIMAVIFALTLLGSAGRYMHEYIILTISQRAALIWRARMFRRLIHAPMAQLLKTGTADHISRLLSDTAALEVGYRAILGSTIAELTKGGAALVLAFVTDWRLTLLALIAAPPIAIALRKFGKKIRRASKRAMQQRGRIVGALNEALGGLGVVKVHNAEGYERRRFGRVNRELFAQEMKMRQARSLSSPVIDTVVIFAVIVIASIAAWLIFKTGGQYHPERYFMVLAALAAAGGSLKPLTSLHNQLAEAKASAARVLEVVNLPVEPAGIDAPRGMAMLPRHSRSIHFEDVTFAYAGQNRPAVQHVDLEVKHGQTIAIVGANGSGKTTLLGFLPRLFEPASGRVFIDDVDISKISLRSLRKQMAVVTQTNVLFAGTIAQNIAYGRRYESMDRIVAAPRPRSRTTSSPTLPLWV